jgi:tetratricopeptide (TPR) repeat protein
LSGSLECLDPLIKLLPNSGLPYILRASVIKDRATAFDECTKAIKIAEKTKGPELAAAYLLRGSMLWDTTHQREGIEDLNRVEELNPEDYDLYYNRGEKKVNKESNVSRCSSYEFGYDRRSRC